MSSLLSESTATTATMMSNAHTPSTPSNNATFSMIPLPDLAAPLHGILNYGDPTPGSAESPCEGNSTSASLGVAVRSRTHGMPGSAGTTDPPLSLSGPALCNPEHARIREVAVPARYEVSICRMSGRGAEKGAGGLVVTGRSLSIAARTSGDVRGFAITIEVPHTSHWNVIESVPRSTTGMGPSLLHVTQGPGARRLLVRRWRDGIKATMSRA